MGFMGGYMPPMPPIIGLGYIPGIPGCMGIEGGMKFMGWPDMGSTVTGWYMIGMGAAESTTVFSGTGAGSSSIFSSSSTGMMACKKIARRVPMQYGVVRMITAVWPRNWLLTSEAERTRSLLAHAGTSATPRAMAREAATMKRLRRTSSSGPRS